MNPFPKSCLYTAMLVVPALAADWPPLSPEIWAMKEDPVKGVKDAVILENRTLLKNTFLERIIRVRILSEAGRKAVELDAFSDACYDFSGRTVYPDGKVLKFDKRQDFKKESTELGDYSRKRTVVIPPGVTGNCVVELRWLESTAEVYGGRNPLPARLGYDALFFFGGAYQTLLETVEVPIPFAWNYVPISGRTQKLEVTDRSGFRVMSARNIPALEQPPFSLPVSLDRPVLSVFFQPEVTVRRVKEGQKEYWDAVGRLVWKEDFESDIRKGRHYETLRARVFQGIPSNEPQVLASKLLSALEKEIVNVDHLTHEERSKWPKDQKTPPSKELGEICEVKASSGWGMVVLLYHLLKDAGLRPKVAFLADRDVRLFRPGMFNPWQAMHAVVVVEEQGKGMLYLDPSMRFAAPGLLHPDFQGVQGLLLDPKADWAAQPFTVPIQPAAFNKKHFDYLLEIGDEEDRFKVNASFSGFPEFAERRRYDEDDQAERNRRLKERFEKDIKGAAIQKADVRNAENPTDNVAWAVEGQVERESGRQRQVIPFPGLTYPLHIPDAMPKERSLAIVMPYLQTQSAISTFKIPKGYRVHSGLPTLQRNTFGSVTWLAEVKQQGEDSIAVVTLKMTVETMFAGPTAYEELKTYLGWISEVYRRTLILEKI